MLRKRRMCNLTELHETLYNSSAVNLQKLVENGQDPNIVNEVGYSPLMRAAREGNAEILSRFLGLGNKVKLNLTDRDGSDALILAAFARSIQCTTLLIKAGCSVTTVNKHGISAIRLAATCKSYFHCYQQTDEFCYRVMSQLVGHPDVKSFLDLEDLFGRSMLEHAAQHRNKIAVEFLLKVGANPNFIPPDHIDSVKEYTQQIESGDDMSNHGRLLSFHDTPLMVAIQGDCFDIVSDLIAYGADVNQCFASPDNMFSYDEKLESTLQYPLSLAFFSISSQLIQGADTTKLLLKSGADPFKKGPLVIFPPVYFAINTLESVKLLLQNNYLSNNKEHHDPITSQSKNERTTYFSPLHYAYCHLKNLSMVSYLLQCGYNVHQEWDMWVKYIPVTILDPEMNAKYYPKPMIDNIIKKASSPSALMEICRSNIRGHLRKGEALEHDVETFEIPSTLKDYLLLKDELEAQLEDIVAEKEVNGKIEYEYFDYIVY